MLSSVKSGPITTGYRWRRPVNERHGTEAPEQELVMGLRLQFEVLRPLRSRPCTLQFFQAGFGGRWIY